jgi:hypothetical protein
MRNPQENMSGWTMNFRPPEYEAEVLNHLTMTLSARFQKESKYV